MLLFVAAFFIAFTNAAIVITTPHGLSDCTNSCNDQEVDFTNSTCQTVQTGARVMSMMDFVANVTFGLRITKTKVSLLCSCNATGFDNEIVVFQEDHRTTTTYSAELYYFSYNKCGLIGKEPVNYTCVADSGKACAQPRERVVVAIDTSQKYLRCDIKQCLDDHGHQHSHNNISCSYLEAYWKCATLTRCDETKDEIQTCHMMKADLCTNLQCPSAVVQHCTQTPPSKMGESWNCTQQQGGHCSMRCPSGYETNWLHGEKQFAASCNTSTGVWTEYVNASAPCKRTDCGHLIKNCMRMNGWNNSMSGCTHAEHYVQCARNTDCGSYPSVELVCQTWSLFCTNLNCPSSPSKLICPNTPTGETYGAWGTCTNDTCDLSCFPGYYVDWTPSMSGGGMSAMHAPHAAVCNKTSGEWELNINTPGCKSILPAECPPDSFHNCVANHRNTTAWKKCETMLSSGTLKDYQLCAEILMQCTYGAGLQCEDRAPATCCEWQKLDSSLKGTCGSCSHPCTGQPGPSSADGSWVNCDTENCGLDCGYGYYANYNMSVTHMTARPEPAVCVKGSWSLNVVEPICPPVIPLSCPASSIIACVNQDVDWPTCLQYFNTVPDCTCSRHLMNCAKELGGATCWKDIQSECNLFQFEYCTYDTLGCNMS